MADPTGKGFLDKSGLFVACKMVALVQADVPLTIDNAFLDAQTVPAPFFGPDTAPGAPTAKMAPADPSSVLHQKKTAAESINFLVKPEEKRKYDALFDQLQPVEDKLPGDKVWKFVNSSLKTVTSTDTARIKTLISPTKIKVSSFYKQDLKNVLVDTVL